MKIDKSRIQSCVDHINTAVDVDPWAKELVAEMGKEILKAQLSKEDTTSDCISRRGAIDICNNVIDLWQGQLGEGALVAIKNAINNLPSVQPVDKDINVSFKDAISRQGAIDHFKSIADATSIGNKYNEGFVDGLNFAVGHLETMPSIQPDVLDTNVGDLISRQGAIDYCYQLINVEHQQGSDEMNYGQVRVDQTETILHHLEFMPSVQPYTDEEIQKIQELEQAQLDKAFELGREDAKPQWIPVTERLPENGRQVLVFARSVHYALAKYDEMREADGSYKKQWVTFDAWKPFYTIKDVIAWMPLPDYTGK